MPAKAKQQAAKKTAKKAASKAAQKPTAQKAKTAKAAIQGKATPSNARLVILDGHGIIYRAYFAVREPLVVRRSGEVVTAVYGFINTMLRVIDELKPTHIAVAMDAPGPTFRHEADAEYKATRRETPDDLPPQIERCKQVLEAFNIPIYEVPGYEADDVLATLADDAAEQDVETWIATLDSDLVQLVRPGVSVLMYRPYQRDIVRYDSAEKVRDRYGIDPEQMIDFKGLVGDTSDNIPGVPGIGEKTAVKLLNEYRTIEEIYEHLDEVGPKRAHTALAENQEVALHSKMMATIHHEVPIEIDMDEAQVHSYDRQRVMTLFQELEFRSLIDRLPEQMAAEGGPVEAAAAETDYITVRDERALATWVERAQSAGRVAVQLETTTRDPMRCQIAGYALADVEGEAAYIPVRLDGQFGNDDLLDPDLVLAALRPLLESSDVPKQFHDAKFAIKVLARHGLTLRGIANDTMLAAFLLGDSATRLHTIALERLGIELPSREALLGKGKKQKTLFDVSADETGAIAAAEVDAVWRLAETLDDAMADEPQIEEMYRNLELPLAAVLAHMELTGVTCDRSLLDDLSARLGEEIDTIVAGIYESVGHEFNIGSPKQLGEVLFEELGLPKTRKTKQGYSTDAQALERLAPDWPIVDQILKYREHSKLKSTYVDALPGLINPETGRIHTDYNQAVAATGRLSSENPNLQNIPVRTEMGREIRAAFVARARNGEQDVVFLGADYSQIELRVLAHLANDPNMIEAFQNDEDIHAATAAGAYGVDPDQVDPEMRRIAKMMNFGVIYGLTAHGLSQRSGMERRDAQAFIDAYFDRFARVAEYIEEIKASTKANGYAETLLGRRRYIPEIKSPNFQVRSAAERVAVNMPVQGTAADVMKKAMLQIDEALGRHELATRMLLQVHDELIFELPRAEAPEVAGLLQEIMPHAIDMVVPLKIDMKIGPNWRDMDAYAG